jgi:hypothetical protein
MRAWEGTYDEWMDYSGPVSCYDVIVTDGRVVDWRPGLGIEFDRELVPWDERPGTARDPGHYNQSP